MIARSTSQARTGVRRPPGIILIALSYLLAAIETVSQPCRRYAARLIFPLDRWLTPTANTNLATARLVPCLWRLFCYHNFDLLVATQFL
jgi:hypothetical protein